MARDILKSNNSLVFIGQKPAFTTGIGVNSQSSACMSAVQNVAVGFSQPRQKSKQIGSKGLAINDITRSPDVDLSIDYYYTPAMLNENMLGLINDQTGTAKSPFFSGYTNEDQNFFIANHPNQGVDMIQNNDLAFKLSNANISEVISIGNAFLTNYSLGFSIGSLPVVSTTYKCSNINIQIASSSEYQVPAINLNSGNNNNVGEIQLTEASISGFGDYTAVNRLNPPLCSPTKVNSTLQNLQIGGAPISGDAHLQSFSFNIPINRVDLFGLGSDYPYGRKVQYPLTSSVSVEFLVSGLATGEIANLITAESGYDFDVGIVDTGENFTHTFSFSDLKLESSAYQMNVNDQMIYSLSFSHEITN